VCQTADNLRGRGRVLAAREPGHDRTGGVDDLTFDVVFGVFAAIMLLVIVLIARSAILRDRRAREAMGQSRGHDPESDAGL
jgi:hypothetical protein